MTPVARLGLFGAFHVRRAVDSTVGWACARLVAAAAPPAPLASCVAAGALFTAAAVAAPRALWPPEAASLLWSAPTFVGFGAALLVIAALAALCFRLAKEKAEALQLALDREASLTEAQHRIGNTLSVISAILAAQRRQLGEPSARRAIEQAAGRILVIAEVSHMLDHLTSTEIEIDHGFVRQFVAKRIDSAGAAGRVRVETAIDPISLPKFLLTPLALVLNECVSNALEYGFPGDASGTIAVRLEARGREQGARRLTITDRGPGELLDDDQIMARGAGVALVNALAVQLGGSFRLEEVSEQGVRAALTF